VLQDIEQVASLDVEDDLFEPDAALRPELRVAEDRPLHAVSGAMGRDTSGAAEGGHTYKRKPL
jgi:hypothetical protein